VQGMSTLSIGGAPQVRRECRGNCRPSRHATLCLGPAGNFELGDRTEVFFRSHVWECAVDTRAALCIHTDRGFHGHRVSEFEARRFAPIISRLRVETSPRTNTEWDLDYDFKPAASIPARRW
jgi:hypothetical protein